jgi:hypothetical protein
MSAGCFMQNLSKLRSFSVAGCACAALLAGAPASAQHAAGWHGGGWHGGGSGWRGGYGWRGGFYGPWGWGLGGLGVGLYFATLPYYYSTYWWGGVPYYYADNNYYIWNGGVGQYQTVAPPAEILSQANGPASGQANGRAAGPSDLIAYPKNGQSEEQLGKDKYECHRWAVTQTGFDPTQVGGGTAPGNRSDYFRAQAACLEGRGYSVK